VRAEDRIIKEGMEILKVVNTSYLTNSPEGKVGCRKKLTGKLKYRQKGTWETRKNVYS
jgi:hypothetical protein